MLIFVQVYRTIDKCLLKSVTISSSACGFLSSACSSIGSYIPKSSTISTMFMLITSAYMASTFFKGSASTCIGCLVFSLNFSLPSSRALCTEALKRVQRDKLWHKNPWNLQNPLFFLCSKGGSFKSISFRRIFVVFRFFRIFSIRWP